MNSRASRAAVRSDGAAVRDVVADIARGGAESLPVRAAVAVARGPACVVGAAVSAWGGCAMGDLMAGFGGRHASSCPVVRGYFYRKYLCQLPSIFTAFWRLGRARCGSY